MASKKRVYSIFESEVALEYLSRFSDPWPPYRKFGFFPEIKPMKISKRQLNKTAKLFREKLQNSEDVNNTTNENKSDEINEKDE